MLWHDGVREGRRRWSFVEVAFAYGECHAAGAAENGRDFQ